MKVSFAWKSKTMKNSLPSLIPIHWHALCVCLFIHPACTPVIVLIITYIYLKSALRSTSSDLWESWASVSPFHFLICLENPRRPQSPNGYAEAGLQPGYQEGVKWEGGTLEAGVGRWQAYSRLDMWHLLEAVLPVFSFLTGKWLLFSCCNCCPLSTLCEAAILISRFFV